MTEQWTPPVTFEERLKAILVPPWLYIRYKAQKELFKGEGEVKLLPFLVDPKRNAVDAGANKGTYTYFLARLAQHVYAFEPNPKMFTILRRSMARNVTASPVALSNRSGDAELRVPRQRKGGYSNQGGSLSSVKISENYKTVDVAARRLDEFDLGDVGFIKIDVEGFEQAVLEGARETIMRERPVIQVELEEQHTGRAIEQSFAQLREFGMDGFFLRAGKLVPLSGFDAAANLAAFGGRGYINNFIFRPKEWTGPSWD
jgi:FkbM family methyltransferase